MGDQRGIAFHCHTASIAAIEHNAHELGNHVLKYIMVQRTRREIEEFCGEDLKKQKIFIY